MPEPKLDRIAIVMMSALGDTIHVLAVINALKRHAPQCRITWILQPLSASLVRGHPSVDEIIEFSPQAGAGAWLRLRQQLRGRSFDVVLDLQVAIKAGLATALLNAPVKIGFDIRRSRDLNWLFTTHRILPHANQHVLDQYFEFLQYLGVPHDVVEWKLGPWSHELAWAHEFRQSLGRPAAAIVVGSSNPEREWPAERWADVVDVLDQQYGLQPVLVGGSSARERSAEQIIGLRARHKPLSTLGCDLRKLVAILDASVLVLTPDTAPLHMAVALGRPVISLMAASDYRRTGPYRSFEDLVVEKFRDPGDPAGIISERRDGRMQRIAVADVAAKIEVWRQRYA